MSLAVVFTIIKKQYNIRLVCWFFFLGWAIRMLFSGINQSNIIPSKRY